MKKLHVYVVSLVTESKRRNAAVAQLIDSGLSWSFFDAIDARNHNVRLKWLKAIPFTERRLGRSITPGEIACAESHYELYKCISTADFDFAMVLEDDFILSPRFLDFAKNITNEFNLDFDILMLGYSKLKKSNELKMYRFEPIKGNLQINGVRVGEVWRDWTCGTVGYLINKNAAIKIVNSVRCYTIADDWFEMKKSYNLVILHCRPLILSENFVTFKSSIGYERDLFIKPHKDWLDLARYARGLIRSIIMRLSKNKIP